MYNILHVHVHAVEYTQSSDFARRNYIRDGALDYGNKGNVHVYSDFYLSLHIATVLVDQLPLNSERKMSQVLLLDGIEITGLCTNQLCVYMYSVHVHDQTAMEDHYEGNLQCRYCIADGTHH